MGLFTAAYCEQQVTSTFITVCTMQMTGGLNGGGFGLKREGRGEGVGGACCHKPSRSISWLWGEKQQTPGALPRVFHLGVGSHPLHQRALSANSRIRQRHNPSHSLSLTLSWHCMSLIICNQVITHCPATSTKKVYCLVTKRYMFIKCNSTGPQKKSIQKINQFQADLCISSFIIMQPLN